MESICGPGFRLPESRGGADIKEPALQMNTELSCRGSWYGLGSIEIY